MSVLFAVFMIVVMLYIGAYALGYVPLSSDQQHAVQQVVEASFKNAVLTGMVTITVVALLASLGVTVLLIIRLIGHYRTQELDVFVATCQALCSGFLLITSFQLGLTTAIYLRSINGAVHVERFLYSAYVVFFAASVGVLLGATVYLAYAWGKRRLYNKRLRNADTGPLPVTKSV